MNAPRYGRRRSAFTLLEMMLSLALIGLLMVGLNTFVFSMSELWGRNREPRLFDQHVRAVTRFLDRELRAAALPPVAATGSSAFIPRNIRNDTGLSEDLLVFELTEGSRLLNWPERPLPEAICALAVRRDEGLVLLWHSRLEVDFDEDPPRETVITPLVTALAYEYFDPTFSKWESRPELRRGTTGTLEVPQRLRLTFTYQNLVRETVIPIPGATEGVPVY